MCHVWALSPPQRHVVEQPLSSLVWHNPTQPHGGRNLSAAGSTSVLLRTVELRMPRAPQGRKPGGPGRGSDRAR